MSDKNPKSGEPLGNEIDEKLIAATVEGDQEPGFETSEEPSVPEVIHLPDESSEGQPDEDLTAEVREAEEQEPRGQEPGDHQLEDEVHGADDEAPEDASEDDIAESSDDEPPELPSLDDTPLQKADDERSEGEMGEDEAKGLTQEADTPAPSTPLYDLGSADDDEDDEDDDGDDNGDAGQEDGMPATVDETEEQRRRTEADRRFRERMRSIDDEPKVAMFGFKSSGKSWLLHRLRRHLYRDLGAQLDPRLTELPEAGTSLPGTSEFELHEVIDKYPWSIIDSPGEYSKRLVEGKVENMWEIVHVLARSSAIIVTIPADVLVFGSQMDELDDCEPLTNSEREEIAKVACGVTVNTPETDRIEKFIKALRADFLDLQNFGEGLYRAAGALSYVRSKGIDALDPAQYAEVTWEGAVKPHVKGPDFKPVGGQNGLACPVYIALTKTDRLVSVLYGDKPIPGASEVINKRKDEMLSWPETKALRAIAERGDLLSNPDKYPLTRPSQFVQALEKPVHNRFVRFCPMSRFDFVSAFFGHDYSTELQFGHYRKYPEFGVASMQQWIQRAIALSEKGDKRISRQGFARQLHFAIHGIPQPGAGSVKRYKRK